MITWSDQQGSRDRAAWLLLIRDRDDLVVPFGGDSIPGIVAVRGYDRKKDGKWSHTTYRLELAAGVRHIDGREGWGTGRFPEGLGAALSKPTPDTWADVAALLGVSVPATMALMHAWRPKDAERLARVEAELVALEAAAPAASADTDIVTVSFSGSATSGPKPIPGYEPAEIRLKDPDYEWGWETDNIIVSGVSGAVLSVTHTSGRHGGYYAVRVAVVPGTDTLTSAAG